MTTPGRPDEQPRDLDAEITTIREERRARDDRKRRRGGFIFIAFAASVFPLILWGTGVFVFGETKADKTEVSEVREFDEDYATLRILTALKSGDPVQMDALDKVVIPAISRNFGCLPVQAVGPYKVKDSEAGHHARLLARASFEWKHQGLTPGHASIGHAHLTIVWRCQPDAIQVGEAA